MREINASTLITVSKREIVSSGITEILSLTSTIINDKIEKDLISLAVSDLKDEDNIFKVILTIQKIDKNELV